MSLSARAAGRRVGVLGACAALLLSSVTLPACRDSSSPESPGGGFAMAFSPGAVYEYTMWQLDRYGYRIASSAVSRTWSVVAVDARRQGYDGVTLVVDQIGGLAQDTLLLRCLPTGDVYQYGYLARMVARLYGETIPPAWDLLAAFSRGRFAGWTVGVSDSLGLQQVAGQCYGDELLFEVEVNGAREVVPGVRVYHTGDRLDGSLWLADAPAVFLQLREEQYPATGPVYGTVSDITSVSLP